MGNGVALIDNTWLDHSRPGILAACPVRIAPAEELIWHRLFISERHRHDMSDIVHLILCCGETLDWDRLVGRVGEHWPLLLSQVLMFSYVYPGYRTNVPNWVSEQLLERARAEVGINGEDQDLTRGPLISRFSFTIDVTEWGFNSSRGELIRKVLQQPELKAIVHPECTHDVVTKADLVGSTEFIIKTVQNAPAGSRWAIGTELNLVQRLARAHPEQDIAFLDRNVCYCSTMNRIDLPHLVWALE